MLTCCELALYIALGAFGTIALLLLMFFGYNLRLGRRTLELEIKNGKELAEIEKLKKEVERLKSKNA